MLGMWATFKGLIAMMLGGLGSVRGAIAGGLAARHHRGPQRSGFSGRRCATSSPVGCCSSLLVLAARRALLGASRRRATAARSPRRNRRRTMDDYLIGVALQHRHGLVRRAVGLYAAADRRDLVRPAGLLRASAPMPPASPRRCGSWPFALRARARRGGRRRGRRAGRARDAAAARLLFRDGDAGLRGAHADPVRAVRLPAR